MDIVERYLRPGTLQLGESPPLALYVHLPWCLAKCPYCDFNSHALPRPDQGGLPESRYIEALIADLEASLPQVWGRPVHSVFIGGGTPSLFSADAHGSPCCRAARSRSRPTRAVLSAIAFVISAKPV